LAKEKADAKQKAFEAEAAKNQARLDALKAKEVVAAPADEATEAPAEGEEAQA
jgi:small subunit ribosomal protein S16